MTTGRRFLCTVLPVLLLALAGCSIVAPSYRNTDVTIASNANFDPARYAGRWYEVARYPNPFQARCAGAVADYALADNGSLTLRNICLDDSGTEIDAITGRATIAGPGRLSVRLSGVPISAPYWVLWVDEGYRTAVVGQPDGRAGWILNRDPVIPDDRWRAALEILDFNGYDVSRLQRSVTP